MRTLACLITIVTLLFSTASYAQPPMQLAYAEEQESIIRVTVKNYTMFNLYIENGQLSSPEIRWLEDEETWLPSQRRRIRKQHGSASFEALAEHTKGFAGLLGFTGDNNIKFQLKVSFDGKTCDFVTRSDTGQNNVLYKGQDVGSGPSPQAGPYHGMLYKNGIIYAYINIGGELYKVDTATGNREIIYKEAVGKPSASSGTHIKWDRYRDPEGWAG